MLKIEKTEVVGWEAAIRGMRNPMNSWEKSDSGACLTHGPAHCSECEYVDSGCTCSQTDLDTHYIIGSNDLDLMTRLRNAGTDHRKFMRMIEVYVDITAPLYWWKEFDTYKVGTVANSCSTMHKIAAKEFTLEDFSCEHLDIRTRKILDNIIKALNDYRNLYVNYNADDFEIKGCPSKKDIWWQMIQLLPSSYNQKRTVMLNYEVLANMYKSRKNHKLDEWHTFCDWIESLPYSELITGGTDYLNKKLRIPASDEIIADTLRKLKNMDAASPDKSKAILLEFYEKMRKGAPSTPTNDFKIVDEWNQYGHVNYVPGVKPNCEVVVTKEGDTSNADSL